MVQPELDMAPLRMWWVWCGRGNRGRRQIRTRPLVSTVLGLWLV